MYEWNEERKHIVYWMQLCVHSMYRNIAPHEMKWLPTFMHMPQVHQFSSNDFIGRSITILPSLNYDSGYSS